jgi:hypothetical protein
MGFIQKIFGGLFSLLGSILKVFGIGKKSEFYMELDESGAAAPEPAQPASPQPQKKAEAPAPQPAMAASANGQAAEDKEPPAEPQRVISQGSPAGNPVVEKKVVPATEPKAPAVTNFATNYLVNPRTNSAPRRRPGPSVSPFKEMVRDMKRSPSMN